MRALPGPPLGPEAQFSPLTDGWPCFKGKMGHFWTNFPCFKGNPSVKVENWASGPWSRVQIFSYVGVRTEVLGALVFYLFLCQRKR